MIDSACAAPAKLGNISANAAYGTETCMGLE
jgi:hypothetical protein